jgi:uncharacterized damage-inducible protein DinB
MNMEFFTDLYRHMEWADSSVWKAVMECERAKSDEKLLGCLTHLHLVQQFFLLTWRGEPRPASFPTFETAEPLLDWARPYYDDAFSYLATFGDERISEPVPLAWASMVEKLIGRAAAKTTLGDTILQVALHTLYHRGQVNARLREIGGTPPLVDYIAWVWFGRPSPNWTEVGSPNAPN